MLETSTTFCHQQVDSGLRSQLLESSLSTQICKLMRRHDRDNKHLDSIVYDLHTFTHAVRLTLPILYLLFCLSITIILVGNVPYDSLKCLKIYGCLVSPSTSRWLHSLKCPREQSNFPGTKAYYKHTKHHTAAHLLVRATSQWMSVPNFLPTSSELMMILRHQLGTCDRQSIAFNLTLQNCSLPGVQIA